MTPDEHDVAYTEGQRAALCGILREVLRQLGYDSPDTACVQWVVEREAAIAQLRSLCEEVGDNHWDESLNLADVIDKHLARHLL